MPRELARHLFERCPRCGRSDGTYWVYPTGWVEAPERGRYAEELDLLIDELAERRRRENGGTR